MPKKKKTKHELRANISQMHNLASVLSKKQQNLRY